VKFVFSLNLVKLAALKQQNGNLAQVEVDEMSSFVSHIRAKISADNAMPGWIVLFVKLFLDVGSDVL
jgi:hypothetical protein